MEEPKITEADIVKTSSDVNIKKAKAYDLFIQIKYHEQIIQDLNGQFIKLNNEIQTTKN